MPKTQFWEILFSDRAGSMHLYEDISDELLARFDEPYAPTCFACHGHCAGWRDDHTGPFRCNPHPGAWSPQVGLSAKGSIIRHLIRSCLRCHLHGEELCNSISDGLRERHRRRR